jgi:ABC-type antimicrobial peptide transport system permease subunit
MSNWVSKTAGKMTKNFFLKQIIETLILFPLFFGAFLIINFSEPAFVSKSFFSAIIVCVVVFLITFLYSVVKKERSS